MVLTLALAALRSRTVRSAVVSGATRRIATRSVATTTSPTGIVSRITRGLARFGGGLLRGLGSIFGGLGELNFTNIWSKCVSAYQFIYNFNWNITDKELDAQIEQGKVAIAGALGGTLGATLGYAICGGVPATAIAVFNPALAMHVLEDLGEAALDEVAGHVANLVRLTCTQLARMGFTAIYKNMRSILRPAALGVANFLVSKGVLSQASVDAANKKKGEPWSFASALEQTIDDTKDPLKQNFLEEFYEELGEACVEAGYVVAGSLDSFFASASLASAATLGSTRTVAVTFSGSSTTITPIATPVSAPPL